MDIDVGQRSFPAPIRGAVSDAETKSLTGFVDHDDLRHALVLHWRGMHEELEPRSERDVRQWREFCVLQVLNHLYNHWVRTQLFLPFQTAPHTNGLNTAIVVHRHIRYLCGQNMIKSSECDVCFTMMKTTASVTQVYTLSDPHTP